MGLFRKKKKNIYDEELKKNGVHKLNKLRNYENHNEFQTKVIQILENGK